MYRAIVHHYLPRGRRSEYTTALAAGSREHCLAAALRYGPGAAIVRVPDTGAITVVYGDRGTVATMGNA